jgi:RING-box protein 1
MADVDMTDAPSGSTAPAKKAVGKAKAGGATEGGADGKKRFEVKKVSQLNSKLEDLDGKD